MRVKKSFAVALIAYLLFQIDYIYADTEFSGQMSMPEAIDAALKMVEESVYKDVEVLTNAGRISGELVKRSGDVLILKTMTGVVHLKTNKEKINYVLVNVNAIVGISFYSLN